jgi:tetratricopeptide (TPR) repeat protein
MIELNPGYAWGYFHLAHNILYKGKIEEAIRLIMKAIELDPLNIAFHRNLGCAYVYSGDANAAIETFQRTIEMDPQIPLLYLYLGLAYMRKSMYKEALKEMQAEKSFGGAYTIALIGVANSLMGNKDKAYQILNKYTELSNQKGRSQKEDVSFYGLAVLCFSLEEDDLGFVWLEKAYETHDRYMYQIKIDFLMDRIRSDPRFHSLLKKMDLE